MIEWFLIGFLCGVLLSLKQVRDGIVNMIREWRGKDAEKIRHPREHSSKTEHE